MPETRVSGIVRHIHGTGFKITFENTEQAQKYKKKVIKMLKNDKQQVTTLKGSYDKKE